MEMKRNYIGVHTGDRKKLSEQFSVTLACVSDSLNFKFNSILNRRIRSYAMNVLGGYFVTF